MENRKPKLKPKPEQMRCKKHPKHKQAPGVCAVCLAERLSRLASSKKPMKRALRTPDTSSSLSSLSSCDSSSNASSCASPVKRSEGKGYVSFLKVSGKNVILTKSRSMEFYPPRKDQMNDEFRKKKGGFWSKLIGSRSKKMDHEGLMHSKTTRERSSSGVH
ncbi:hypothetical protein DCAR_0522074 [Daucus carota subsp. sativus]|uniref:Uncharacterized protein n=1 Tax=Daucus carota subsp. sativus TaxID=79200 RepID=A0A164ZKF1_DAUCS|nr:PREDICTED: uncharacterized protein LOC108222137 [Daucus carota subsp. sativus]WOH02685.1 hypothetical protein DCAR_0522074 [Daucus carota subsp. sativus]